MLRWLTAGESHGPALVAMIEGLPAGVQVTTSDVAAALARRRLGYGRGARMKFEQDEVEFLGGLRHGLTLGSPVAIRIGNTEWPKWETVMSPDPVAEAALAASDDVNAEKEIARNRPLTRPAARARRPRRHAEVRLRRRPPHPRARLRPRDRGPGGAGRGRRARSSSRPTASASSRTPSSIGTAGVPARTPSCRRPTTSSGSTPTRCAASTPPARPPWSPRSTPPRRTATPWVASSRSLAYGLPAGPRLARPLGPPARRAARRGAHGHPGDQGRRGRRRLRDRRAAAARRPTTRWSATRTASSAGAPAGPAAPRAACRPARCCGCAPR